MRLLFLVAAHGRVELSRACLRQLRRTCDTLCESGLEASAIVVANDANLRTAHELGYGSYQQENEPLGRKFNDAYQLACDPEFNERPADVVVPIGSDDFVDAELLLAAPWPAANEMTCFKLAAFVREDGRSIAPMRINYEGGLGIRMISRELVERCDFRPADEHAHRGIDGNTLRHYKSKHRLKINYFDLHPYQIVDFKTRGGQLNTYDDCMRHSLTQQELQRPFEELSAHYPREALDEVARVYS